MAGKIVLVEVPAITDMCDIAEAELPRRGHAVTRHPSPGAFKAAKNALGEGDVLFALGMPVNRELLASAKPKAVVSPFTGTEFIDVAAATELGIVVGHGQVPENSIGMAESSIMLMLALLYDLHRSEKLLRENLPRPPRFAHIARGKTVGIIGLGSIARETAQRLAGWEMKILAYTPRPRNVPANVQVTGLDELLAQSDVVMVHASMNRETKNLIDARRIGQMKKNAILINTSRGGIVDEKALAAAMHEGRIAGAALDVYETEPLPADSALRDMPNSILTPHMVGQTIESLEQLRIAAVENLARAMEGRSPLYVRNPEVLPEWQRRWAKA